MGNLMLRNSLQAALRKGIFSCIFVFYYLLSPFIYITGPLIYITLQTGGQGSI